MGGNPDYLEKLTKDLPQQKVREPPSGDNQRYFGKTKNLLPQIMRDSHVIGRNSEKMTKDLPPRRVCEPPNQVEQAQFLGSNGGNPGYLDQLMKNDSQNRPLQVKTKIEPRIAVCEPPNQNEQAQFLGSMGGNPGYLDQLMKNDSQNRPSQVKTKIEPRIAVCEPPPRTNQIKVEEDPMAGFLGSMGGNPGYLAQLTK